MSNSATITNRKSLQKAKGLIALRKESAARVNPPKVEVELLPPVDNFSLTDVSSFVKDNPLKSKQILCNPELWKNAEPWMILPAVLPLDGKPMNVHKNRPMFKPLFTKTRKCAKEIYMCGRQIGKTVSGSASMILHMVVRRGFRVMYIAPLSTYVHRLHHMYFQPMLRGCYLDFPLIPKGECVNNVTEKSFFNASHFHGVSCFNNPENARGIPADWDFYDEVQGLNYDHIPAIRETLGSSKYKWETYMGTALGVENTIAILFNQSSKNRWVMKCGKCNHHNIPTTEHDALAMIQPQGVSCSKCSAPIDVANGEWVPEYPSRENEIDGFLGRHVPQIIIPDRVNVRKNYLEIYNKLHGIAKYPLTKFCQEVLGDPTASGGRHITQEDIHKASTLPFTDSVKPNYNEYVSIAGGVDWGGNEVTSYTVGTAVGWHPSGEFHCLGAIRPLGVPENERHLPIGNFMKKVPGLKAIGGDVGFVGSVQNRNLSQATGIGTASIGYVMSKAYFMPKPGDLFVVDRSSILYTVFTLIKQGKIKFPATESFRSFTQDLLALFVEEVETPQNSVIRRYSRYIERADDFAHSLAYAVLMCSITSGVNLPSMIGLGSNQSMSYSDVDYGADTETYNKFTS